MLSAVKEVISAIRAMNPVVECGVGIVGVTCDLVYSKIYLAVYTSCALGKGRGVQDGAC